MADPSAIERLSNLKREAESWFSKEEQRLKAQADFLENILKKRGGDVGRLQDVNAEGASKILEDSINDYLGQAAEPPKSKD